jgi:iron complex transport system substrate-binding protein
MPHAGTAVVTSRRGFLAAGGALTLAALLGACGDGQPATSSGGTGDGPWSFVDDRNETVTAERTPARVVAFTGAAAALHDFGVDRQLVGVFGETTRESGEPDPQAGDLDVRKLTVLGNVWGEFSVERYAALNPELLVTHMYDPGALWYVPDESRDKILKLAPSIAVTVARVPMTTPIERYAALAAALGADLDAPKVTEAKARFEVAAESVRSAVRDNPGIRVLAASGSPDLLYVSNPQVNSDLMYFAQLGVEIVIPEKPEAGGYYESLSWENAGKYPADLILLDSRGVALQPAELAAKPAWRELPAVRAGQVTAWDSVPRFSYAGAAPLLQNLAAAIRSARKAD